MKGVTLGVCTYYVCVCVCVCVYVFKCEREKRDMGLGGVYMYVVLARGVAYVR